VTPTATLRLLPSLRPCRTIRGPAFDRFDEILYLVEKASNLTLPDLGRNRPSIRCDFRVANGARVSRPLVTLLPWRPPLLARQRRAALRSVPHSGIGLSRLERARSYSLYIECLLFSDGLAVRAIPALARHRRVRRASPTRLTDCRPLLRPCSNLRSNGATYSKTFPGGLSSSRDSASGSAASLLGQDGLKWRKLRLALLLIYRVFALFLLHNSESRFGG
jgi:hypothetical protein